MGAAEEADLGHRRSELQTQIGAVQHEQGHTGAQQGELFQQYVIILTSTRDLILI